MNKDLTKIKDKDLLKEAMELKEKKRENKFSAAGKSKDSFETRKDRKKVARILTELNTRNK